MRKLFSLAFFFFPQYFPKTKHNLGVLDLSGNFLTGFDQHPVVLPWSRLQSLQLDSNMLQGPLPIPPPSTFEYSVSGNKLTGEISSLICNMSSLMLLDLSSNNLSGKIPQGLANFPIPLIQFSNQIHQLNLVQKMKVLVLRTYRCH